MSWPKPITLHSKTVRLVPLSIDHASDLMGAVKDGKLYNHWYTSIPKPKNMKLEIERRLKLQDMSTMLPFAVISLKTEKAVGMTTYMNV